MPIIPKIPKKGSKAAQSSKGMAQMQKEQQKERRMITDMLERERVMKWLLIGVVGLLVLLILFAGYATDWLRGLNKDAVTNTPTSSLDASTTPDSTADTASGASTAATGSGSTGTNTTGTKSSTSSDTSKETGSTSTTTNSTTTNNSTTAAPTTPTDGILSLYGDSGVGDDISSITNNADLLNLDKICHTELLVQVCDFTEGAQTVTTKSLLGSGLVTSITKNF